MAGSPQTRVSLNTLTNQPTNQHANQHEPHRPILTARLADNALTTHWTNGPLTWPCEFPTNLAGTQNTSKRVKTHCMASLPRRQRSRMAKFIHSHTCVSVSAAHRHAYACQAVTTLLNKMRSRLSVSQSTHAADTCIRARRDRCIAVPGPLHAALRTAVPIHLEFGKDE